MAYSVILFRVLVVRKYQVVSVEEEPSYCQLILKAISLQKRQY